MNTKTTEHKLTVRFPTSPTDLLEELRTVAAEHERSLNGEIIWALRDYVARQKKQKEKERS